MSAEMKYSVMSVDYSILMAVHRPDHSNHHARFPPGPPEASREEPWNRNRMKDEDGQFSHLRLSAWFSLLLHGWEMDKILPGSRDYRG